MEKNAEVVWPKPIHGFCEAMNGLVTFGLAAFDNEKQGCFLLKYHVVSVHVFPINGGNKQTKCCEIKETIFYFDEKIHVYAHFICYKIAHSPSIKIVHS